jgi:acylglycerol lipase
LIQHGLADRVTDPKLSQALYDEACSEDKTIRLYDGMWHALPGEPDENIEKVYKDTIEWITDRISPKDSKKTK